MKRALIVLATNRIAQVALTDFQVAPGLAWRDCADDVTPETHFFDGVNFILKPPPPAPPDSSDMNNLDKALKALALLTRQYANALKAGTYVATTPADVRTDFMTIYRALP